MTLEAGEIAVKLAKKVVKSIWADMRLVERVREAWGRGVSARAIAADLARDGIPTNRNAVIGIVHRHRFESPMSACNKPKRPAGTPRPRRARAKPVPVLPPPKPDWRGEIALPASEGDAIKAFGKPCRLWELVDGCRWPLGDTREAAGVTFCNAVQVGGLPYCATHTRLAYQPYARPSGYGAYSR